MENFSISPTETQIITFKNGMSLRRVSTINIKISFVKRYLCNAKIVLLQRDILSNSYFRYLLDKTLKRDEKNIVGKKYTLKTLTNNPPLLTISLLFIHAKIHSL